MSNSGQQPIESCPLPPGYGVDRATERDIRKLYNTTTFMTIMGVIALLIGMIVFWLSIQSGLQNWERIRQAKIYEFGARSQTQTPNLQDWYRIIIPAFWIGCLATALVVGIALISYLFHMLLLRQYLGQHERWIAKYENQIIGHTIIQSKPNYSVLLLVCVNPEHWWQGVGSCLVWHSVKDAKKPIYLTCLPRLQAFYRPLGFVAVQKQDLPPELRRKAMSDVMALFDAPTLPTERRQSVFTLPYRYSIRTINNLIKYWQVYHIFWSREPFRQSRIYVLMLITTILVAGISVLAIVWKIAANLNITWLFWFIIVQIAPIALWLAFLFGWQEWIVEHSDRPIAYAHFSSRPKYTVLYCLHVEVQHQAQNIGQALLERLTRRIQLPIYLICPRDEVNLYTQLGFRQIRQQTLPLELKIIWFSNYVALKLPGE